MNRIWHHLFGAGIVRTPDDFGSLGDRPSHPQLLDYLSRPAGPPGLVTEAADPLTGTYPHVPLCESCRCRPPGGLDPENRLLHHFPLRRLEAEALRDAILVSSGRLNRGVGGRSIDPYRFQERKDRRLFSGPLDGRGRRSLYTKVTLTEEPPFLTVFNLPEPKQTRGRRDVTSVPRPGADAAQRSVREPASRRMGRPTCSRIVVRRWLRGSRRCSSARWVVDPESFETARFEGLVNRLCDAPSRCPPSVSVLTKSL